MFRLKQRRESGRCDGEAGGGGAVSNNKSHSSRSDLPFSTANNSSAEDYIMSLPMIWKDATHHWNAMKQGDDYDAALAYFGEKVFLKILELSKQPPDDKSNNRNISKFRLLWNKWFKAES
jgi:hypothetical protein